MIKFVILRDFCISLIQTQLNTKEELLFEKWLMTVLQEQQGERRKY